VTVGHEAWDRWLTLSIYTRRRFVAGIGLVAVVALIALVAVPALPCAAPGGDACPPTDHAIDLVPADALAYAHLNVDPDTDQYKAAQSVASRVPTLVQQAVGRLLANLPGPHGAAVDFGTDIQPWFGGEAALAILPTGGRAAQEVQLLQAGDEDGARQFADAIASGTPSASTHHDVPMQVDSRGLATAVVGGFLAIGTKRGVREVIDADTGSGDVGSLASDPTASAARDSLPEGRLADLYLSEDGIARLIAAPKAPLATLAAVVNPGASKGVAAGLVASDDGLDLDVRSTLDPARTASHPGFFSAFHSFEPTLPATLSSDSLGYLGIGDPGEAIGSLLEQASADEPGLAAAVADLVKRVKSLGKIDLESDLLPALGDEAALALEPARTRHGGKAVGAEAAPSAGGGSSAETPILMFVGAGVDTSSADSALARLQGPVAKALDSSLQAPVFSEHKVAGVTTQSLRLSPTVDLTYAIVDSILVIATDPNGVRAVSTGKPGLDHADLFRQATTGLPGEASVLGYLNLAGLVALGEQAGLASDPAYATFAPEIQRLEALGLAVQSSSSELATDARLIISSDIGSADGAPAD
jgi:hypothetical protein